IVLEKTRQTGGFSTYYVIAHWRVAARLARRVRDGDVPGFVVPYEKLVYEPAGTMGEVCNYLEIDFDPDTVLTPTKVGQFWSGNSAARIHFSQISSEPATRWQSELSKDEIGWVEWHWHRKHAIISARCRESSSIFRASGFYDDSEFLNQCCKRLPQYCFVA